MAELDWAGLAAYLRQMNLVSILCRFVLAAVCGSVIGFERGKKRHAAGLRTHIVVCIGAMSAMLVNQYIITYFNPNSDPARMGAQVISGIGFLGAGTIVITGHQRGQQVKGLTTAAGMWATSAIGMAIGAGLYWVGLVGTAVLMCVQLVLHRFPIGSDAVSTQELSVRMRDRQELLDAFEGLIRAHRGQIIESNISREEDDICLEVVAKLPEPITHDEAIAFMKAHSDVTRISV